MRIWQRIEAHQVMLLRPCHGYIELGHGHAELVANLVDVEPIAHRAIGGSLDQGAAELAHQRWGFWVVGQFEICSEIGS